MRGPHIGALRHRLRLEAPIHVDDGSGGSTVSWQPVAMLWAEVISRSGREVFMADGLAAVAMHQVRIRYRSDVTAEMRFVMGDRILDIRAVRDVDGRRAWLSCLCEERAG